MIPCGIAIPQDWLDAPADMARVRAFVARADELAYDSLWVTEEVLGGAPALDPSTLLAYVAALTQRVRIGVWVLLFLALFTVIAWRLNAAFWKDVK